MVSSVDAAKKHIFHRQHGPPVNESMSFMSTKTPFTHATNESSNWPHGLDGGYAAMTRYVPFHLSLACEIYSMKRAPYKT